MACMSGPAAAAIVEKVAKGRAQGLAVEVARPDHVEPRRLQCLGDKAGVVGGGRQSRVAISRVPDDKGDAGIGRGLLRLSGGGRKSCSRKQDENRCEKGPHAHHSIALVDRRNQTSLRASDSFLQMTLDSATTCLNRVGDRTRYGLSKLPSQALRALDPVAQS